ncbi:astacin-like metalloprotease toxin 1 [Trichonephila clavata]|uniref:Metalloendopeptidase n=1 Tax=Trichonephila clavata TaxID=2740835 RepID=A0A8X6FKP7_TRICU|nr:astacin-like metalloprotease toxin 1 [Trichonephila clavata]
MKILILFSILAVSWGRRTYRNPLENPDLYQGDIAGIDPHDRNAIPRDSQRWSQGVIYYKMDSSISYFKRSILKAMQYIEDRTCIEFIERKNFEKNYIKIFSGDGCYSHWGRTGGVQPVSLGNGCEDLGTIIHELMHAIGFDHEQNRSDRDDYLTIFYENIDPDFVDQFQKLKPSQNRLINSFDYGSIMLYGDTAFSVDGYKKTMKAKKRGVVLLDTYDKMPTKSDMYRINVLYECDTKK